MIMHNFLVKICYKLWILRLFSWWFNTKALTKSEGSSLFEPAEKNTPFLVQLKQIFGPSYLIWALSKIKSSELSHQIWAKNSTINLNISFFSTMKAFCSSELKLSMWQNHRCKFGKSCQFENFLVFRLLYASVWGRSQTTFTRGGG